jgi:hypothetical protein
MRNLKITLAGMAAAVAAAAPTWGEEPQSVYSDSVADSVCRTHCQGAADGAQCLTACLERAHGAPVAPPTVSAAVPPPDADTLRALAEARTPPMSIAQLEPAPQWVGPQTFEPIDAVDPAPLFLPLRIYHRPRRHIRRHPVQHSRPPAQAPASTH